MVAAYVTVTRIGVMSRGSTEEILCEWSIQPQRGDIDETSSKPVKNAQICPGVEWADLESSFSAEEKGKLHWKG